MNLLLIAAATNILLHPYWETGNYEASVLEKNGLPLAMTNQTHWMKAHTTTNGPSFHIVGYSQYGWIHFVWTDNLTNEWERINCNNQQYHGWWKDTYLGNGVTQIDYQPPIFKVYMHPDSEVTKRMLRSTTGFFKQTTHWESKTCKVDMTGFWPEFCGPMPLAEKRLMIPPPIPNQGDENE